MIHHPKMVKHLITKKPIPGRLPEKTLEKMQTEALKLIREGGK